MKFSAAKLNIIEVFSHSFINEMSDWLILVLQTFLPGEFQRDESISPSWASWKYREHRGPKRLTSAETSTYLNCPSTLIWLSQLLVPSLFGFFLHLHSQNLLMFCWATNNHPLKKKNRPLWLIFKEVLLHLHYCSNVWGQ